MLREIAIGRKGAGFDYSFTSNGIEELLSTNSTAILTVIEDNTLERLKTEHQTELILTLDSLYSSSDYDYGLD